MLEFFNLSHPPHSLFKRKTSLPVRVQILDPEFQISVNSARVYITYMLLCTLF